MYEYVHTFMNTSYMLLIIRGRHTERRMANMNQFILFNIESNALPQYQLIVRKLLTEIEFYEVEMLQFPIQFFSLP